MFHWLERNPFFFAVGVFIVIAFAGLVEVLPDFANKARPVVGAKPYSPLELAGRQVYINESCNSCHSQLIRPFKSETDRYGQYSVSGEYAYDRPFLWGSKRTGPDLHRVGNYRSTDWHENHMWEPSAVVPGSIMPSYKHLFAKNIDAETAFAEAYTVKHMFGVPYDQTIKDKAGNDIVVELEGNATDKAAAFENAKRLMLEQAKAVASQMKNQEVKDAVERGEIRQIVALIAYMNSLK
ncbi:MAG: cytochrome-c oxidase, cbb3-type subunit II [Campylobacterales bacterium]